MFVGKHTYKFDWGKLENLNLTVKTVKQTPKFDWLLEKTRLEFINGNTCEKIDSYMLIQFSNLLYWDKYISVSGLWFDILCILFMICNNYYLQHIVVQNILYSFKLIDDCNEILHVYFFFQIELYI